MTKICVVTKVFAGFYFCRLFLYRLTFLPTIINADFFLPIRYFKSYPLFLSAEACANGTEGLTAETEKKEKEVEEPKKLWTGFGEEGEGVDDIDEDDESFAHPYSRKQRANQRRGQRKDQGFGPKLSAKEDRKFRALHRRNKRKWTEWIDENEKEWNRTFFDDDHFSGGPDEGFKTITFDNEQFRSEEKKPELTEEAEEEKTSEKTSCSEEQEGTKSGLKENGANGSESQLPV